MRDTATTTTKAGEVQGAMSLRATVFRNIETAEENDTTSRIVDICLITLILASVIGVLLESIPQLAAKYSVVFSILETVTISAFTIEYLLRLWTSVEVSPEAAQRPFATRLRYVVSFHAIVDLLAVLPYYLLMGGVLGVVDMRVLRALSLLRVLKLMRYSPALNMLLSTFRENSHALTAAFLILVTVMLLAASGIYYFERNAQPEDFGSIPAAMWWAFATLTTVGYGDVTPITVGGKVFGALITVVGIGMVALPTSILASGYSRQLQVSAKSYEVKAREAFDDGVLTAIERRDLESLRIDLGLDKHTASQILDARQVQQALREATTSGHCPHCQQALP